MVAIKDFEIVVDLTSWKDFINRTPQVAYKKFELAVKRKAVGGWVYCK